jgi:hypothetical protein
MPKLIWIIIVQDHMPYLGLMLNLLPTILSETIEGNVY